MRSSVVLVLACLLSAGFAASPGQTGSGRISGKVAGPDGAPLASVAITLRSAVDSAIVTGVLTDKNGVFRIEGLAPGRYMARISLVGYKSRSSEVVELTAAAPSRDLGSITLEAAATQLGAVEAVVRRIASGGGRRTSATVVAPTGGEAGTTIRVK